MSLSQNNPYIDEDLDIVISTFERSMIKSQDEDAVLVPIRRTLGGNKSIPTSVITGTSIPEKLSQTLPDSSSDNLSGDPGQPTEDVSDSDDDWIEEAKKRSEKCLPCDFRKEFKQEFDSDFANDFEKPYTDFLDNMESRLDQIETKFLDNASTEDFFGGFCSLAESLKSNCAPDLKKMLSMFQMMKDRAEIEVETNLNIFESLVISGLTNITNEMLVNLDLVLNIGIQPLKCIVDQIEDEIERVTRGVESFREEGEQFLPATVRESAENRARQTQQQRREQSRSQRRSSPRARETISGIRDEIQQATTLEEFKGYIERGIQYITQKVEWLKDVLSDLVENGMDELDGQIEFGSGKNNILRYMSIISALIDAARGGEVPCGPEHSDGFSEEELYTFMQYYRHPSESLEISLVDGNLVVLRTDRSTGDSIGSNDVGADAEGVNFDNIILERPISSCLKKISSSEADQVRQWISQLE